jgi:hypothetical protein
MNKFENFSGNINPDNKNNKKEKPIPVNPFKPGELFDANKEIIELKKLHGEAGLEQVKIFKEKLNYQKRGIVVIEERLFRTVREFPDSGAKEMQESVKDLEDQYALNAEQRGKIERILRLYQKKHKAVAETLAKFKDEKGDLDGGALFEFVFGFKPDGRVKAVVGPMSLCFKPSDMNDYALLAGEKYPRNKKHKVDADDLEIAKGLSGIKLQTSLRPELKGTLMLENPIYFNENEIVNSTLVHEERHVFNSLINHEHLPDHEEALKKMKGMNDEDAKMILLHNAKIEGLVKDEISAFFSDGSTPKAISLNLLGQDIFFYYVFGYNMLESDEADDFFDPTFVRITEDAIIAFADLLHKGYSLGQAQSYLYSEPLVKWAKVSERLTGHQKSALEKERDRQKYISKIVLKQQQKNFDEWSDDVDHTCDSE